MRITFVTTRIERKEFTGGTYCLLRHANELVARGHEVCILTCPKSVAPEWIDLKAKLIIPPRIKWARHLPPAQAAVATASYALDHIAYGYKGDYYSRATAHAFLSDIVPDADITVATLWETASLVAKYGKGKKVYFCQHYEPLFFDNVVDRSDVDATYSYGLTLIANSSWLKSRLERRLNTTGESGQVHLAVNAIDPSIFTCQGRDHSRSSDNPDVLRVISYGGRRVQWKGFMEMALAMQQARRALPDKVIEWSVYGEALLPPDNEIAPYKHLGFLSPTELASAYRMNDVLLSASWYESFPLFPIEAMACGLAVITTAYGTEDYAVNEENCLIVEPQNIDSIARAIIRLSSDRELIARLGSSAEQVTRHHNWQVAGSRMEEVLHHIASASAASGR